MEGIGSRDEEYQNVLTEQHLRLFGVILHWFAQYELTIRRAIAGILGVEVFAIVLLTRDIDFVQKRSALLDLLRHRQVPNDIWDSIFAHLVVPTSRVQLREQIIHATWKMSPEPHSIQPNWILRIPRGIEPAYQALTTDDTSYSLDLLADIAANLAGGHKQFTSFLLACGFIAR